MTICAMLLPLLVGPPPMFAAAPASVPATTPAAATTGAPLARESLRERLAALDRLLARHRMDGDIRTHLLFRRAHEPYTRATLTCLVQAERLIHGWDAEGRIEDAEKLLRWCDVAVARSPHREGFGGPRPFAGQPTIAGEALIRNSKVLSARLGWLASGPVKGDEDLSRELDLAACLGVRWFVDARSGVSAEAAEALAKRGEFAGVRYTRAVPAGTDAHDIGAVGRVVVPPCDMDIDAVARWRCQLWLSAISGRAPILIDNDQGRVWERPWFVEEAAHVALDLRRLKDAVAAFPGTTDVAVLSAPGPDETPRGAGPLQRRYPRVSVCEPEGRATQSTDLDAVVARALADAQLPADWIDARDVASAETSRYRALVLIGLDRPSPEITDGIRRYRDNGGILLAVGRCLSGLPRSGRGAIRFDLEVAPDGVGVLCDYLSRLRQRRTILAEQIVPTAPDGRPVPGLITDTARDGEGRPIVCLVNHSDESRAVVFRQTARPVVGHAHELLRDQPIDLRAPPSLPPHAVWLVRLSALQ